MFKKGDPKIAGRKKGSQNVLTKTVKEVVLDAFTEMQKNETVNLKNWGKENPALFYQIAAKLIPTELTGSIKTILTVIVKDE